jgi:hypothetical protein
MPHSTPAHVLPSPSFPILNPKLELDTAAGQGHWPTQIQTQTQTHVAQESGVSNTGMPGGGAVAGAGRGIAAARER